jgi:FtsZ-interacting cell division protein ZipA
MSQILLVLIGVAIVAMLIPSRWDPDIRLKEYNERNRK